VEVIGRLSAQGQAADEPSPVGSSTMGRDVLETRTLDGGLQEPTYRPTLRR
jgi:hypothetical protein